MGEAGLNRPEMTLRQKVWRIHWMFVLLLCATAGIGFAMLYSAAGGNFDPWASRQMVRFAAGLVMMVVVAAVDIRLWLRYAYAFYILALALLTAVELGGSVGMGAQRWINLGVVTIQPSEVMKLALVSALARYFHVTRIDDVNRVLYMIPPLVMVVAPAALVLRQPDLGTALMLMMVGGAMFSSPLVWPV